MSRTHAREEDSTEYREQGTTDWDKKTNLISRGTTMSSTDDLEQRVVELESRVEELEQLLDDEAPTDETSEIDIIGTSDHDDDKPHPRDVINDIPGARSDGVVIETVIRRLGEEGFDDPEAEVDKLRRRGEIYSPTRDFIKVV